MEIDNEKGFGKRYEPSQSKKLHFPNMHLRISNKYEEIQRRIEKSRSMDSIANLDENSEFREVNKEHELLRETSHAESDNSVTMHKFNAVITDVQKNEADIFFSEVAPDISTSPKQIQAIDSDMHHISSRSLESLNEVFKGSNEYLNAAPTPPIKVSIRDKIGSRISAAKEKRRREEIEKNAAKDKKKERQKVEKLILSNTTKHSKVIYKKEKLATVTIALIEATGLDVDATEDKPKLFLCRFKLGTEKYKSKTAKCKASDVKWQELFNFNLFDETLLEISLFEKDILVGRTVIDVSEIEKEKTHQMRINLDAADSTKPQIFILLTISGLSLVDTVIDLDHYQASQQRVETIRKKYQWAGCLS